MKLPTQLHPAKDKVHIRTGHEVLDAEQRYNYTLCLTSMLDEVGGQRHSVASLPLGKESGTHYTGG